jgi:hypothetical protein
VGLGFKRGHPSLVVLSYQDTYTLRGICYSVGPRTNTTKTFAREKSNALRAQDMNNHFKPRYQHTRGDLI